MIGIDIDDVIADYVSGIIDTYGDPGVWEGGLERMWPWIEWDAHFETVFHNEFLENLLPVDGSTSGTAVLNGAGIPLVYISARPKTAMTVTEDWLEQWGFPAAPIILTGSDEKKINALKYLDVTTLVEDKASIVRAASDMGISCFLLDKPWNRHMNWPRALGWTPLMSMLHRHMNSVFGLFNNMEADNGEEENNH